MRRACYHIEPLLAPNSHYYAAFVLFGGVDRTAQAVEVSAASPLIRVILKPGATICGTVEDGAGSTVLLWPENAAPGD